MKKSTLKISDVQFQIIVLTEKFVYAVKSKQLAMSFELPKPFLYSSIKKIIWNLRITKQPSIEWTPNSRKTLLELQTPDR